MSRCVNGILLLDKPHGMTSNKALQQAKHLFNAKKAGHTGSLDPIATGMLPICFGEATKFSQFLLESNKTYYVVAKLGVCTDTADCEGRIIDVKPVPSFSCHDMKKVMENFIGTIEQIPPMYSAIKYQGKALYKFARQGITIERSARKVKIFALDLIKVEKEEFAFTVHCSKGTYIRTLVEDMGNLLGCGAHVIALRRQTVTPYDNSLMYTLDALSALHAAKEERLLTSLLPIETSVKFFPAITLSKAAEFYLRLGHSIRANNGFSSALVRLLSEDKKFLGVGEVLTDGRVKPHRLLSQASVNNIPI